MSQPEGASDRRPSQTIPFALVDVRDAVQSLAMNLDSKLEANGIFCKTCGGSVRDCTGKKSRDRCEWNYECNALELKTHGDFWSHIAGHTIGGGLVGALLGTAGWRLCGGKRLLAGALAMTCGLVSGHVVGFFTTPKSVYIDALTLPDDQSNLSKLLREILQEHQPRNPFVQHVQARVREQAAASADPATCTKPM